MGHTPSSRDLNNTRLAITPVKVRLRKRHRATGRPRNLSPSINKGNTGSRHQVILRLHPGSSPATRRNIHSPSSRKGVIPSSRLSLGTVHKASPSRLGSPGLLNLDTRHRPAMGRNRVSRHLATDLPRLRLPHTRSLSRRVCLHSDPLNLPSRKGVIRCRPSNRNSRNSRNNLQGQEADLCRLPRRVLLYARTAGVC